MTDKQYEGQHAENYYCQNKKYIIKGQHIRLPQKFIINNAGPAVLGRYRIHSLL